MKLKADITIGQLVIPSLSTGPILKDFHVTYESNVSHEESKLIIDELPKFVEEIQTGLLKYIEALKASINNC